MSASFLPLTQLSLLQSLLCSLLRGDHRGVLEGFYLFSNPRQALDRKDEEVKERPPTPHLGNGVHPVP